MSPDPQERVSSSTPEQAEPAEKQTEHDRPERGVGEARTDGEHQAAAIDVRITDELGLGLRA